MNNSSSPAVVVIGGGPAGLMAAIRAAERGATVTLCERLPQPGRRLLATGGGCCNLTNALTLENFVARFGQPGRFMITALKAFGREELLAFMAGHGVPCSCADGFHYFPDSQKAGDILLALDRILRKTGVRLRMNTMVDRLLLSNSRIAGVTAGHDRITANAVVLATGGLSYPELGGHPSGRALARAMGHTLIPPVPGLVGLTTHEVWPGECAGIVLPSACVRIGHPDFRRDEWRGDLLFTHHGISGPPILDLSGRVARRLLDRPDVSLRLNFMPGMTAPKWTGRLVEWQQKHGRRTVKNLLGEHIPRKLAAIACREAGIDPLLTAARLPRSSRDQLAAWLAGAPLTITGTDGLDRAMVTSGGITLKQVNSANLESRLVPGLYFAGEILDLDGPCGGFNLQWAFSSGRLAGLSAASSP